MIDPAELANRLLNSEKGLTPERFEKLAVHLVNRRHMEQVIAACPASLRDTVRQGLAPYERRLK